MGYNAPRKQRVAPVEVRMDQKSFGGPASSVIGEHQRSAGENPAGIRVVRLHAHLLAMGWRMSANKY